jgi:hypothetical protein
MRDNGNKRSRGERAVMGRTRVRTYCMCQSMRNIDETASVSKVIQIPGSGKMQAIESALFSSLPFFSSSIAYHVPPPGRPCVHASYK